MFSQQSSCISKMTAEAEFAFGGQRDKPTVTGNEFFNLCI